MAYTPNFIVRARETKDPRGGSRETMTPSTAQPPPLTQTSSTATLTPTRTDVCRVQVRLPNGRVSRHNFPCSASLNNVARFVHWTTSLLYSTGSTLYVQPDRSRHAFHFHMQCMPYHTSNVAIFFLSLWFTRTWQVLCKFHAQDFPRILSPWHYLYQSHQAELP